MKNVVDVIMKEQLLLNELRFILNQSADRQACFRIFSVIRRFWNKFRM